MYLTIAHMPLAPDSCDPGAEVLRPIDPFSPSKPTGEVLVVRRSREPRVWLAPPRHSWLTTHLAFEMSFALDWREASDEAWLPVAFLDVVDVAPDRAADFERAQHERGDDFDEQPGFLSREVLRPIGGNWHGPTGRGGCTYIVLSRWTSAAAYRTDRTQVRLPDGIVLNAATHAYTARATTPHSGGILAR